MDSLTQAALGAAIGEAMLGKKLGNRGMLWGIAFGTLPDLDVLISPFLDTANNLIWHRGPSHSLLIMILASIALGRWLSKLWVKQKISMTDAAAFVFAVWSTHVLLDCFTVYGTSVLWPFTEKRVAFNNLFIIDPLYTLPLLVTLIWLAFLRTKKQYPKRRKLCWWGLGLSTGYVCLSLLAKWAASAGFDADLHRRNITFTRRMEAPTPFNILLWRSVVERENEFWVGYRNIFEFHDTPVRWTVYPKGQEAYFPYSGMREPQILSWFSDGWWIARRHKQGLWMGDLRFGETRRWETHRDTVDSRLSFSWIFYPKSVDDPLRPIMPDRQNPGENLSRLTKRILGDRTSWEGSPRLAGIHGSFPETLQVEE